jgi:hypothetical protein
MNRLVVVLLLGLCFAESRRMKSSLVPYAIKSIVDKYYAKNDRSLQVINFGEESGTGENIVAMLKTFPIPIQIFKDVMANRQAERARLDSSCILIYDSMENYNRTIINTRTSLDLLKIPHNIYYIANSTVKDIELTIANETQLQQNNYLITTDDSIELVTHLIYSTEMCDKIHSKVINRFSRGTMQWENSKFFVEKFSDFHNCPVLVEISGKKTVDDLYSIFSSQLNFSPVTTSKDDFNCKRCLFMIKNQFASVQMVREHHIMEIHSSMIHIPPGNFELA